MYDAFYGFERKPFSLRPDPELIYLGARQRKILAMLRHGVVNGDGFTVLIGDIGCGKTTLSEHLQCELASEVDVGVISNTHQSFERLGPWLLRAFGMAVDNGNEGKVYDAFRELLRIQRARDRNTLLVIDEAHNLPIHMLEELRLFANTGVDGEWLRVLLVGQLQLRDTLRRPELRQFAQRISVGQHLRALDAEETGDYIQHRVSLAGGEPGLFEVGARALIYEHSSGVPRVINSLCDAALVHGYEQRKRQIDEILMNEVLSNNTAANFLGLENPPSVEAKTTGNTIDTVARVRERGGEPETSTTITVARPERHEHSGGHLLEAMGTPKQEGAKEKSSSGGGRSQRITDRKRSLDEILESLSAKLD